MIGTRAARQVWPCDWIRTLVSRPRTVVTWGSPERTSRHTGALLSGCVCIRCCSAVACAASFGLTAGFCANATPAANESTVTNAVAARTIDRLT
jgi:hypothetical protein